MRLKDYLTAKQVKAYATTARKALEISIKHHWQNSQVTLAQFGKLEKRRAGILSTRLCGLCIFHKENCDICSLGALDDSCFNGEGAYNATFAAYGMLWKSQTRANFAAFIQAEKQMHKVLCSLRGKSLKDIKKMRKLK